MRSGVDRLLRRREMLGEPGKDMAAMITTARSVPSVSVRATSRGTRISASVTEPWRPISSNGPVSAGSSNATSSRATRATSPSREAAAGRTFGPNQHSSRHLLRGSPPMRCRCDARRADSKRASSRPAAACSQRNRPSPDCRSTWLSTSGSGGKTRPPDVDLAVVGGDHQRGPGRERLDQVLDHPVDEHQLGVVEEVEAVLVGHLVDAVVVGVDERLARVRADA